LTIQQGMASAGDDACGATSSNAKRIICQASP
jgi:hypothetical protein